MKLLLYGWCWLFPGQTIRVPCHQPGCGCKAFAWVPSRPEDVGEYWLPKRRDFDPVTWRMKCRCKHTHEDHDVGGQHRCHSVSRCIIVFGTAQCIWYRCYPRHLASSA